MMSFSLNEADWAILREKFKRKYNHLTDEDLMYEPGKEEELINKLAVRVNRNHEYILFTLQKELANLSGNRL